MRLVRRGRAVRLGDTLVTPIECLELRVAQAWPFLWAALAPVAVLLETPGGATALDLDGHPLDGTTVQGWLTPKAQEIIK